MPAIPVRANDDICSWGGFGDRTYRLEAGDSNTGHQHNYHHYMQIVRGRCRLRLWRQATQIVPKRAADLTAAEIAAAGLDETKRARWPDIVDVPIVHVLESAEGFYQAGDCPGVPALLWHQVTAVDGPLIYRCLFTQRDFSGGVAAEYLGVHGAFDLRDWAGGPITGEIPADLLETIEHFLPQLPEEAKGPVGRLVAECWWAKCRPSGA